MAVKSLNEALSRPAKSRSESDARMAAALALAFQSTHLEDGLLEFITMVRGCNLIATSDTLMNSDSVFSGFREEGHLATMQHRLATSSLNSIDPADLDAATMSLQAIKLLNMTFWEQQFHNILVKTVESAYDRPVEAYTTFVMTYNLLSQWTNDEFQSFIDPDNNVAQILLAHFIAVQALLVPILLFERLGFQGKYAPSAFMSWIKGAYENLRPEMKCYATWCMNISRLPWSHFLGQRRLQEIDDLN